MNKENKYGGNGYLIIGYRVKFKRMKLISF